MNERLQKILARAGYGSRRSCETLIAAGRVRVNGRVVKEPGVQADAASDRIEVDGKRIEAAVEHVYLAMNKPPGYTTTSRDPHAERTVMSLLPDGMPPHVFPIGRLDRDTEGLLLFTSDGDFAHRLAHPRYEIEKEYLAFVEGVPSASSRQRLQRGIMIEDVRTAPARAEVAPPPPGRREVAGRTWLKIVIHEGRKRQVRLMCAAVGHPALALVRTRVGDVPLARLTSGRTRPLTPRELSSLRHAVGLDYTQVSARSRHRGEP